MCQRLTDYGIPVTFPQLQSYFPDSVITRAHYAKFLIANGFVKSAKEAFERYVGDFAPCFVPREKVTPIQAIELINQVGGISVLAHPPLYRMGATALNELVSLLSTAGLTAIESVYSTYSQSEERQMRKLAKEFNLAISGGSDFHGTTKPDLDLAVGYGKLFIPDTILYELRNAKKEHNETTIY